MSYRANTTKERYGELKKDPIFFCKYQKKVDYEYRGIYNVGSGWISCNPTIYLFISDSVLSCNNPRRLFLIESFESSDESLNNLKEDTDLVFFEVTEFNPQSSDHWSLIFEDCAYNFKSGNSNYCHMALFWALYTVEWDVNVVLNAFNHVSNETAQICINHICSNFYVLSLKKQKLLLNFLKTFRPTITTLIIKEIEDALKELSPTANFEKFGLFQKVDYIVDFGINPEEGQHLKKLFTTSHNSYIYFKFWLLTPNRGFYNYGVLEDIHSYVNPSTQLAIVKRYLHDVRLNTVPMDYDFIRALRNLKYSTLFHVRNFIERPGDNINLSSLLFCDILLTLKNSNGDTMQDFNGMLDLAVLHSNPAYPNIDLGIKNFLPICDGGLKANPQFVGFIHYSIVYDFDESLITEENLKRTLKYILKESSELQCHYCCSENNDEHLEEDKLKKCSTVITLYRKDVRKEVNDKGEMVEKEYLIKENGSCPYLKYKPLSPLTWKRKDGFDAFLNSCLDLKSIGAYFTQDNIDLKRLEESIRSWAAKSPRYVFPNGSIPKEINDDKMGNEYFSTYYKATYIILYPNTNVFYSSKKDLLGLWSHEVIPWNEDEIEAFAQQAESSTVFSRTFQALKKLYPKGYVGKDYVAIPYDATELSKVKDYFYYNRPYTPNTGDNRFGMRNDTKNQLGSLKFLFTPKLDPDKIYYCTPKLSDSKEKVSELPFFWCRSVECFCNVLDNQTLEKCNDWNRYTLYHAAEIIGFKLIEVTENGNLPDERVAGFAAEVRQVERYYARLVCRACGHMIFSTRGTILHGSNFFACKNPSCKQYDAEVYLSQCSNCKRGLIDSRDSQKCENGWVICPSCLSCCNDKLFDSLIAKHRRNGNVPARILNNKGKGHNNKGIFFCPKCKTRLGTITVKDKDYDEKGNIILVDKQVFGCPNCKRSYEKELKLYKDHLS